MKKRSLTITFSAFVLMLSATLASAATFTLSDLDNGQEFTIGVLRFFNWDFDALGSPVNPDNVTITTIDDTAKPGFTLAGNGELTTGDELELNYAFDIETTNGQALIRRGEMNLQSFQQVDSVLAVALVEEVTGVDPSRLELFITQGVPGLQDTTFSTDTFAVPALFFPTVNAVGMRLFDVNGAAAVDSYSVQFVVGTASDDSVDLSGAVQDQGGTGLCAMVLASGQFTFSCNPNGPFSLTDLPRENDGTVMRQVYVDGFFPEVNVLQDSVDETVTMTRAGTCPEYNPPSNRCVFRVSAGKRINISGKVLLQDTGTPICAMVLANGQFTFTCDGSGQYALNVPLDANGQFKLQVYAQGFAPTTLGFDEFSPTNDVRLARAAECQ